MSESGRSEYQKGFRDGRRSTLVEAARGASMFLQLRELIARLMEQSELARQAASPGEEHPQALHWRHHQAGMLQAYLAPGTRIHVWHPDLLMPGMRESGARHNHRFSFQSTVLAGLLCNTRLTTTVCPSGDWQMFDVIHAATGKTDDPIVADGGARYHVMSTNEWIEPGQTYAFPAWEFHESSVNGLAVTLLHKFGESEKPARLLAPYGSAPRHAFKDPPKIDHSIYVRMAIDALRGRP